MYLEKEYKILELPNSATLEEVKKQYRNLSKKYHPDLHQGNSLEGLASEKFQQIKEAYDKIIKLFEINKNKNKEFYIPFLGKESSILELKNFSIFFSHLIEIENFIHEKYNYLITEAQNLNIYDFCNNFENIFSERENVLNEIYKISESIIETLDFPYTKKENEDFISNFDIVKKIFPNEANNLENCLLIGKRMIIESRKIIFNTFFKDLKNFYLKEYSILLNEIKKPFHSSEDYLVYQFEDIMSIYSSEAEDFKNITLNYFLNADYQYKGISNILASSLFQDYPIDFPKFNTFNCSAIEIAKNSYNLFSKNYFTEWGKIYKYYLDNNLELSKIDEIVKIELDLKSYLSEHIIIKLYKDILANNFQEIQNYLNRVSELESNSKDFLFIFFPKLKKFSLDENLETFKQIINYLATEKYKYDFKILKNISDKINSKNFNLDNDTYSIENILKISEKCTLILDKNKTGHILKEIEKNTNLINDLKEKISFEKALSQLPHHLKQIRDSKRELTQKKLYSQIKIN